MRQSNFRPRMGAYAGRSGRLPAFSPEEEIALCKSAQNGDEQARNKLTISMLSLVISVARKYSDWGVRCEDLVQEGTIGLLQAIEHYDPKKGTRLATYAVWWIRAYIQRYLQNNRSHVRQGDNLQTIKPDLWLNAAVDEDQPSCLDQLVDERSNPERDAIDGELSRHTQLALQRVRPRLGGLGWDIVQRRLMQDSANTLEEIGRTWGVSRERVRQVELKTKVLLARYLKPLTSKEPANDHGANDQLVPPGYQRAAADLAGQTRSVA